MDFPIHNRPNISQFLNCFSLSLSPSFLPSLKDSSQSKAGSLLSLCFGEEAHYQQPVFHLSAGYLSDVSDANHLCKEGEDNKTFLSHYVTRIMYLPAFTWYNKPVGLRLYTIFYCWRSWSLQRLSNLFKTTRGQYILKKKKKRWRGAFGSNIKIDSNA